MDLPPGCFDETALNILLRPKILPIFMNIFPSIYTLHNSATVQFSTQKTPVYVVNLHREVSDQKMYRNTLIRSDKL